MDLLMDSPESAVTGRIGRHSPTRESPGQTNCSGAAVTGLGLRNMRERAFNAGARLDVTSALGGGTSLELRIPLRTRVAL